MKARSGRRGLNFRLQTMLVLVAAVSIAIGLVTRELHRQQRKNRNAAEVARLGGQVRYNLRPENKPTGIISGYLRAFLGDKYFTEADSVALKRIAQTPV